MKKTMKVAALALIIIASFFLDTPIRLLMEKLQHPLVESIMLWFSHEITILFILVLISALFLYEEHKKKHIPVIFTSFTFSFLFSYILKLIFERIRPGGMLFITLGLGDLFMRFPDFSFPSTHAMTAFSILPVIDKDLHKIRYFWIFFSVMVAISRIYLNMHYLSDVVAGIIFGYLTGMLIFKIEQKHELGKKFFQSI